MFRDLTIKFKGDSSITLSDWVHIIKNPYSWQYGRRFQWDNQNQISRRFDIQLNLGSEMQDKGCKRKNAWMGMTLRLYIKITSR